MADNLWIATVPHKCGSFESVLKLNNCTKRIYSQKYCSAKAL